MKYVHITGRGVNVLVECDYNNVITQDCPELKLKTGDDMILFYRNNQSVYTFKGENWYTKPYTPQEKLNYLINKNPKLQSVVDLLGLEHVV